MTNFKDYTEKYNKLLPVGNSISCTEAERRAGLFLEALATLINFRHVFGGEKIKYLSVHTSVYAQELSKGTAKTMTENKVTAEASQEYTSSREALEGVDNDLSFLKSYQDLYTNAHIFYRNMAKGIDNG